ncbi:5-methyltetrahydropteroyltriglutamate--homocysteine S-methyltransferase [Parasphingopyxis marina]|uniref:5-methyltetrahydropteroyltriglutamate--homocysteine S-methyltransferase n=1 Tax=Parasphingopyxis marina TaxID=2761622 RepID=A0A842I1X6_9SPHN|nr:5-methyltetrahydropteroyltriglutamate--homocysteine S-methyltransferase [Parasphingopyxis marina]MBC2778927.1 5-methyltetrahydropteroyltriglutamate--homocysteine S-methyltransferase [Parasphingopyxis marina]
MSKTPPFHADHVGSLLRSTAVHQAREKYAAGEIDYAALQAAEDAHIRDLIAKQEEIGLKSVTDGETRRAVWSTDFLQELEGMSFAEEQASFGDKTLHPIRHLKVTGKLGFSGHPMIEHFRFLDANTNATAKMTIPSPAMLVSPRRNWREVVDRAAYDRLDTLYEDLAEAYRQAVQAFYDAGCRYLQFDDCAFAFLCDEGIREEVTSRGDDPRALMEGWTELINSVLAAKPADMTITTHMCRGNFRSKWLAQGGYETIADLLFERLGYDGFFLEYDSDRAGGFEPLRRLRESGDQVVVLGLLTTKVGTLEAKDDIKRRIEQATEYVPLDRLRLSPQCGFASTEAGNELAQDEQWAKLKMVVDIADEVWS